MSPVERKVQSGLAPSNDDQLVAGPRRLLNNSGVEPSPTVGLLRSWLGAGSV
jgi:hypothetical protein